MAQPGSEAGGRQGDAGRRGDARGSEYGAHEAPGAEGWPGVMGPSGDGPQVARLSTIQRILLATDGTVTSVLEAYAGEPMALVKLSQRLVKPPPATPLQLTAREQVMARTILLEGKTTATAFLYAQSLVVPQRLHPRLRHELVTGDEPIG